MKTKLFLVIILMIPILICCNNSKKNGVDNVYRYYYGKEGGYDVWIVDGNIVRSKIYQEWLYGGNEQRYLFNPKGEIWIDNAISCEEFEMTLRHELNERHLMAKFGWTYDKAHDSSLAVEVALRAKYKDICANYENSLPKFPVTDYSNKKEIKTIPDSVQLQNIYRLPLGERNGIKIWIVDGYLIRRNFFPDFGFSGNDLVYHFIPPKEIWIDGQISCEETEYSIFNELKERELMTKGESYDDAYEDAIALTRQKREKMNITAKNHFLIIVPDSTTRDAGEIDPNEK